MSYDLYHAALAILHDECPEQHEYRLCDFAEDDGCGDCTTCWERYLHALLNVEQGLPPPSPLPML